jgi:hypothetical protein
MIVIQNIIIMCNDMIWNHVDLTLFLSDDVLISIDILKQLLNDFNNLLYLVMKIYHVILHDIDSVNLILKMVL